MIGDGRDQAAAARRSEINGPPVRARRPDQRQDALVVGQDAGIEIKRLRQTVLEGRLALAQGQQHGEQGVRAPPELGERGLDQEIRADERSVEIDDERPPSGLGRRSRSRAVRERVVILRRQDADRR